MVSNKIIGYILLVLGLLIIFFTLYQSYNIFTNKASAPLVFKIPTLEQKSKSNNQLDLQKQLQEKINELLPIDILPKILNLLSWSLLSIILILGGGQIAGLGAKMIK